MGYSSIQEVQRILANALTRGTPDGEVDIINIGDQVRDTVNSQTIVQYIRWADEQIDSSLSVIYPVPLKKVVRGEFEILADIDIGDDIITIEDASRFNEYDIVTITDRIISEKKQINSILSDTSIKFNNSFLKSFSSGSFVLRTDYPDPIPLISARYAAASLYDKFFASQAESNTSEYGKELRALAENDFNNILNGRVRLIGQRLLGRRFFNPELLDVPSIASEEKNREKNQ